MESWQGSPYPDIGGVEYRTGIDPFAELVVAECSQPDIEHYLDGRDLVRIALDKDGVVETEEGGEEEDLERLQVLGNSEAGERIGRPSGCKTVASWSSAPRACPRR